MVGHGLLLAVVFGLLSLPGTTIHLAACSPGEIAVGACHVDASVGADDVTLIGTATSPGSGGGGAPKGSGHVGAPPAQTCQIPVGNRCLGYLNRPSPATPAVRPITLRDIAAFRPAPGVQHMEPNGWVVAGLDANFFSVVDQQLVNGTLLGQPATVRFTPVGWHWNYGDGTAVIRATKGATWAAQGLHDFDRTATSHVYETEREYVIRLTIDFRAEYRVGASGFTPISGTINLPANDLRVTVTGAKTVLVNHDCVANPAGPGC
ncbi:MAG: hypothetical protein ABIP33_01330 [Pseudolysinimonas sp.]